MKFKKIQSKSNIEKKKSNLAKGEKIKEVLLKFGIFQIIN